MSYKALDIKTVIDYVKSRDKLKSIFTNGTLISKEVGDGNLNLVFIIENEKNPLETVVLKQALPYLRVAGESWPLTRERMRYETNALLKYNKIVPGLSPNIFDYDSEMSLVVMENLNKHEIMRKPLMERKKFPLFVDHISTFLANILFHTSDMYLKGVEKKELQKEYINPHLNKIQEDFVYTNPFMESEENQWNSILDKEVKDVRSNGRLKLAIAQMKKSYMTDAQALIHSDLHTGSIMVNEKDTKVIDPEFSFFGPIGYDVGALLQNLVINYLSHYVITSDEDQRKEYQAYLLNMVIDIWNEFVKKFDNLWRNNNNGDLMPKKYWDFPDGEKAFADFRESYFKSILHDLAGHGGCKFLRRMMGIVSVPDISSIEDMKQRAKVERLCIKIGIRWVTERERISGINDLTDIVLEETRDV